MIHIIEQLFTLEQKSYIKELKEIDACYELEQREKEKEELVS